MTEPRYRLLEFGELLKAGDEAWTWAGPAEGPQSVQWVRLCDCAVGRGQRIDAGHVLIRRPTADERDLGVRQMRCACMEPERLDEGARIAKALSLAVRFGTCGIDAAHHKTWVIDQMVRALTG